MATAKKVSSGKAVRKSLASAKSAARQVTSARSGLAQAKSTSGRRTTSRTTKAAPRVDINDLASTQPLALVKARFSEMVDRVDSTRDRITITRNGVPVAVLVSHDDLESMVETIEILSDPEAMAAIREAQGEQGGIDEEEVRRRYLA